MTLLPRLCLTLFLLGAGGAVSAPLGAQTTAPVTAAPAEAAPAAAPAPAPAAAPAAPVEVDPETAAWLKFAEDSEKRIADPATRSERLETLRGSLVEWREKFLAAQSQNTPRIDTLREQIAALGAAPADGAEEPPEIAARRTELAGQLTRAQAPGIAAEEAYRRADGLIRETDRILRERQNSELVSRGPAPVNPVHWDDAGRVVFAWMNDLATEQRMAWANPLRREALLSALPLLALELVVALLLMWQGRRLINRAILRLKARMSVAGGNVMALPLSFVQVLLPTAAVWVLAQGVLATGFPAPLTRVIVEATVAAAFVYALTTWLGSHIFPAQDDTPTAVPMPAKYRREGRLLVLLFALLGAVQTLFEASFTEARYGAYAPVMVYPFTLLNGLLLFRMGQLLRHVEYETEGQEEASGFRTTIVTLLSKAAMVIGVAGILLGAAGFLTLADAIVRPAMVTLGVLALVTLLQRLIYDLYALITRADAQLARDALIPVLISAVLLVAAVPVLALVWGMRPAELGEYWSRFQEGFRIGESRISPVDFMGFLLVFGVGYGLTRLIQGGLRSSILPKTTLDTGSRNAIIAGIGYGGIVLAALAAISTAGLDMSSLAMVASALSVGIGFGLQNIVQNFISGVILLIERPVAEGDWVEVGGVQGIVRGISIRSTRVETFDRNSVIVPNASLIAGQVTNFTAFNQTGRVIVPISVGYESDTRRVEKILREIAEAQPMVVLTPPPSVLFLGFGPDGLSFEIRAILRDINFAGSVKTEINHQIMERFAAEGLSIPFAQREVRILNPEGLSPAAAAAAAAAGATD